MSLRIRGKILKLLKTSMLSMSQKQSSKTPVNFRQQKKNDGFIEKEEEKKDVNINPIHHSRFKKTFAL